MNATLTHYVIAFLIICGVIFACAAYYRKLTEKKRKSPPTRAGRSARNKRPPKRCCGSYIPDCEGCPFFKRPLFDEPATEGKKGKCLRYGRDLIVEPDDKRNRVIMEVDDETEET